MSVVIKASDLYYKYARRKATRLRPPFSGPADGAPFDRDDLYEVLPLLTAVMDALGSSDGRVLHRLEEVMLMEMPHCVGSRAEVYAYLLAVMRDLLDG